MKEGAVRFKAEEKDVVDSDMDIFYNPEKKLERDLTVIVSRLLDDDARIALPLAGSGVRGLRMLKESSSSFDLYINDKRDGFKEDFENDLRRNDVDRNVSVFETDANKFLNNQYSFDYVEIDPFGTPNPFLDSSIRKLRHNGILAVTATDTAPLCGTYPTTCKRKYWSDPLQNHEMHESGLRILIRKIQLMGSQHEKALFPILAFSKRHYFKVFFRMKHKKRVCDDVIEKHGTYKDKGPMWLGKLHDKHVFEELDVSGWVDDETKSLLDMIRQEKHSIGFYAVEELTRELKINAPKIKDVVDAVDGSRTHFSPTGFKTDKEKSDVLEIFEAL